MCHDDDDLPENARPAKVPPQELLEQIERLVAITRRNGMAAVALFDQLLPLLGQLEHTMDTVVDLGLPPGLRLQLIRALADNLQSAIIGLRYEADFESERDVYREAQEVIADLDDFLLEQRLETRIEHLASELGGDDQDACDRYYALTHDPGVGQLVAWAGKDPEDAAIRVWMHRSVAGARR